MVVEIYLGRIFVVAVCELHFFTSFTLQLPGILWHFVSFCGSLWVFVAFWCLCGLETDQQIDIQITHGKDTATSIGQ